MSSLLLLRLQPDLAPSPPAIPGLPPPHLPSLPLRQSLTLRRRSPNPLFRLFISSSSPPNPCAAAHFRLTLPSFSIASPSSSLLQVVPFLQDEWRTILLGWLCAGASVCSLSYAVPMLGRLPAFLAQISRTSPHQMIKEGIGLVALAFIRYATSYLRQAFLWEAAMRSVYSMRTHVFGRVLQRDIRFFEGKESVPTGDIAYRISAEANDVSDTIYALLNATVPNTLQLFAMATQMVALNPVLSMLSFLAIPCMLLIIAHIGETLRRISQEANLSSAKLSAYLNEVLPSMLVVKANIGESKESLRFKSLAYDDLLKRLKKRKIKAFLPQFVQVLYIGGLAVLCTCSLLISRSSYDSSSFCSFITALMLLIEPVQGVGKAYYELKQGEPAIKRMFDLTRFKPKVTEKSDSIDLASVKGDIKFCDVTFRYADDMPHVLNGLNLHIKPGERVALVGHSGGGKTTLSKLLLRLYDPQYGSILVDNHDIKDVRLKSLRKHIVLVSQDSMLFSGTVAENIGYRDSTGHLKQKHIEYAARIANADEFISSFADGYETNIGQRGSLLSGGQKQRLAIARALYHKASILILDEATSSLDSRSEMLVRESLEHLMAGCTVLIIAHRLETVLMADRVLLLNEGKLEEIPKSSLITLDGRSDFQAFGNLFI